MKKVLGVDQQALKALSSKREGREGRLTYDFCTQILS